MDQKQISIPYFSNKIVPLLLKINCKQRKLLLSTQALDIQKTKDNQHNHDPGVRTNGTRKGNALYN